MAAALRLELRQSQQLVMTPQLQQAIKLLTLSNVELGAYVAEEVQRNPLLVAEDGTATAEAPPPPEPEPPAADTRVTEADPGLAAETFDTGTENLYDSARADQAPQESRPLSAGSSAGIGAGEALPDLESRLSEAPTLRAHLLAQIGQMRAEDTVRTLALTIVEALDEDGWLRVDVAAETEAEAATFAVALALVQRCEPTGVGARSLAECLALQLAERDRLDPAMQALLDRLDLIGRGDLERLRRHCGVDAADMAEMLAELRALDPRPGAAFSTEEPASIVPDVLLFRTREGGWRVELNAETLPRVLIDRAYAAELSASEDTRAFLATCRDNANWLIRSLDQRARTILRVATEIVVQQDGFFREGEAGLRPLSLRMVADAIGMHESTVSRVTANKYIATERGVFELKYFFTNAVGSGEGTSAESVRARIRRMIAAETAAAVLSDDRIVEILQHDGIDIARRTVAKYRKSLGIASSVERRRHHALRAAE
ncbi:MAG: RNA polymerase factor sigma-54 [Pseudomonadota bacterium]